MNVIPPFSVSMDIFDILYVSYMLPESKLRRYVPESLVLASTNNGMVFLSVVCFHSRDIRVAGFPFMKFSYDQINVRTYVKDPLSEKNGVLFLHSGIDSRFVSMSTNLLGFPWKNIRFRIHATRNNGCYEEYKTHGNWNGNINISAKEGSSNDNSSNSVQELTETIQHITSPQSGYYRIGKGALRFEVRHTNIIPNTGSILHIDFPFLESLNLLTYEEIKKPDIVLIADKATFTAFMPPQRITK